ncbi:MAG: FAD-dependent oxidoreductase [Methylacidiphilales bacterium]|nr:FAD-dependent oxidoreductase [Candidatus Methylacidiphilales bacterium]
MPGSEKLRTTCCVTGGGPAGMMLGYLLARAGVDVIVLEKHGDFFRDFRGDTIHPSTLELMHELGILDDFLKLPYQKAETIGGTIGNFSFTVADFTHLPTRCKFIAFTPQWDFLDFIAGQAKKYPSFRLLMEHEVTDLIREGQRVVGVRAWTKKGEVDILADLVVGADGRSSTVREKSRLPVHDFGAPFDVLWMRVSRDPDDPNMSLGHFDSGRALITINRQTYWQCGFVIAKGTLDTIRQKGLAAFQEDVVHLAPFLRERVAELDSWDKIKLLTVQVNRLERWHLPGLLCIGDAAHAMSPMGGVGINLAIQDAVATANLLAAPLLAQTVTEQTLARVQARREWPTKIIQSLQIFMQNTFLAKVLERRQKMKVPLFPKLVARFPILRRIPARIIGIGFRPEHIHTPAVSDHKNQR